MLILSAPNQAGLDLLKTLTQQATGLLCYSFSSSTAGLTLRSRPSLLARRMTSNFSANPTN